MKGKHVHAESEKPSPEHTPRHSPLSTHGADEHAVHTKVSAACEDWRKNPGRQTQESTSAVIVEP
jgi:hypothetical protein